MNFSITGPLWRTSLKAVPETRRSEVIGTLTECYGPEAPFGEAVRTFISGSHMNNRLEASSSSDLWRIGIRCALTFSLAMQSGMTLARWGLPLEYNEPTKSSWRPVLALVVLVLAACLARNRYARLVSGLFAGTSAAAILLRDSASFGTKRFPDLFSFQVMSAVMMLLATGLILAIHKKPRWVCATGFFALAGSQIVAWTTGPVLFSEGWERYSLVFSAAYVAAFVALIVLSTWPETPRTERRNWTPIMMGLALATFETLTNSILLSEHSRHLLRQGLGFGLIILIGVSVLLAAIRPQFFLACLFALFINLGPVMPWRFSGEGVITPLVLIGMVALSLLLGRSASRRGLRV
jgi:hypothetical protein